MPRFRNDKTARWPWPSTRGDSLEAASAVDLGCGRSVGSNQITAVQCVVNASGLGIQQHAVFVMSTVHKEMHVMQRKPTRLCGRSIF